MAIEKIVDVTLGDKIRYANNCGTAVPGVTTRVMTNASASGVTRGITLVGGGLPLTESQQALIAFLASSFDTATELSNEAMACIANALRANSTKDAEAGCVFVAMFGVTELPRTVKQAANFDALCVDLGLVDNEGYVVEGMVQLYETLVDLYDKVRTTTATLLSKVTARDFVVQTVSRNNKMFTTSAKETVAIGGAKVRPPKNEKAPFTEGTVDDKGKLVRLDGETDANYKKRQERYDAWQLAD